MTSSKRRRPWAGIVVLALLGSGCGSPGPRQYPSGSQPVRVSETPTADPVGDGPGARTERLVATSLPGMGRVVTDGDGWVLYRFDQDGTDPPKSNCAKACTRQWPPALTDGNPELVGIQYRAIGVVIRADGTMQLTLAGSPLYRHAGDLRPGDARGQGVNAAWFTVTPEGRKNQAARP